MHIKWVGHFVLGKAFHHCSFHLIWNIHQTTRLCVHLILPSKRINIYCFLSGLLISGQGNTLRIVKFEARFGQQLSKEMFLLSD
jgi:hypothetical protein